MTHQHLVKKTQRKHMVDSVADQLRLGLTRTYSLRNLMTLQRMGDGLIRAEHWISGHTCVDAVRMRVGNQQSTLKGFVGSDDDH